MLKTVARFVEEPVWKKFGYYQFYWAKLANKEGEFGCSFGKKMLENYSAQGKVCLLKCEKGSLGFKCKSIEFLNDNEELTGWEETVIKKKNNQLDLQKETQTLKQQLAETLIELEKLKNDSSGQNNQNEERETDPIFIESKPKKLMQCRYCEREMKEIVYEIIEPDKTSYFERYFCPKCYKMFHFREPKPKSTKNKEEPIEAKEEKASNLNEKNLSKDQQEFNLFEDEISKLTSSLNKEQKQVFYLAVKDQVNLFFTGAAGTGKSFLLKKIITALELLHGQKKVAVTALTGIAANNINGRTLHSFAGIGLGSEPLTELVKEIQNSKLYQTRWQVAKVLIIDEISMLEGDLLDKLEFIARTVRDNQAPFGGLQLIFAGDFFQLPPVSRSNHFKFSFEAQSWKKCLNYSILLTKIQRQTENRLIELLNEIRFGEVSPAGLTMLKELEQEPKYPADGIKAIQLYATNEEVNKVNQIELTKLPHQSYFYNAIDWEGPSRRISELLRGCLAPNELELKLNAQVMLIKNISMKLVNGSQGIIVGFQERKECKVNSYDWESKKRKILTQTLILPVVRFTNGIKQVIELAEWRTKIPHTNIVQTSRQQIPLILSWAITIHKSQGQSIERLKIDCQNIFAKGQLYVALSRATSVKYLQIIGFRKNHVMLSHPKVNNFYQSLLESQ